MSVKPFKVLWLSQHEPLDSQRKELDRLFGKVEITVDSTKFRNANDIRYRFKESGADEMVIVAPLSVLKHLCEGGMQPLYAEMESVPPDQAETRNDNGRSYRFKKFERLKSIEIIKESIEPALGFLSAH